MIHRQFCLPLGPLPFDMYRKLIIDCFAGGGGASTGIEMALRRGVDHAWNHNPEALGMHRINHPGTHHHIADVFEMDPWKLTGGRAVGLIHFSPDCTHFSKAKGGQPVSKKIRGLVLVMLKWAKFRAELMTMENVEEITGWGPLKRMKKKGKWGMYPDPDHKGRTWLAFLSCLSTGIAPDHPDLDDILAVVGDTCSRQDLIRGFGYEYQGKQIRAHHHDTATIRRRFFLVARCDGRPIVWPEATNAEVKEPTEIDGKLMMPYRAIAECIDWTLPCPSIFLTKEEAKEMGLKVKRPLVDPTLNRVAAGVDRYILKALEPFLVSITHQGKSDRCSPVTGPIHTVTGSKRGEKAVVMGKFHGDHEGRNDGATRSHGVDAPLMSQDTSNRFSLTEATLAPVVVNTANGKFDTAPSRARSPKDPLPPQTTGQKFAVGQATLASCMVQGGHYSSHSSMVKGADEPMRCQATGAEHSVITGTLVHTAHGEEDKDGNKRRGRGAHAVTESMPTVVGSNDLAMTMLKLRGDADGHLHAPPITDPAHVVSAGGQHHGVVATSLVRHFGESIGQGVEGPAPTVMPDGGGKSGLIAAHLTKFVTGSDGQPITKPGPTVTAGSHRPETHGGAASTQGLVSAYLAQHNGGFNEEPGHPATEPVSAITQTGSQQMVVAGSLAGYYGTERDGQAVEEPARTLETTDRFAFAESTGVTRPMTPEQEAGARRVAQFLRERGVVFDGEYAMVCGYVIVDIGMRMLTPRELFRAQGFPEEYVIDRAWMLNQTTGKYYVKWLTKEEQIRMCGNSVCPKVMRDLVLANAPYLVEPLPTQRQKAKPRTYMQLQPV